MNPEIEFTDRQQLLTEVSAGANQQYAFETKYEARNQQMFDETESRQREASQRDSENKIKLQHELQQRQRLDRQRFEERLYAERKKDEM